jgi:hypothetical protein
MTSPILSMPNDIMYYILSKNAYPSDLINVFSTCKQWSKLDTSEFWMLKLKEHFPKEQLPLNPPAQNKEDYKSRFKSLYIKERESFLLESPHNIERNPLHKMYVAVRYGDWDQSKFSLECLGDKTPDKTLKVAKMYAQILNVATYNTIPRDAVAWIDTMKNQRVLDQCFDLIYNDNEYREALRSLHNHCSDVELFGLYNQIVKLKEKLLNEKDHVKQILFAKAGIISSLEGPNEMRSCLIDKFIKSDPLLCNNPENETPTLYDLDLGKFLFDGKAKNSIWSEYRLINAIEDRREQTALYLLELYSFEHSPRAYRRELMFVSAFENRMEKVVNAIFNKFPLDDKRQMYSSLFKIGSCNPKATSLFLEKITNSISCDRDLEIKMFRNLIIRAETYISNLKRFRIFAQSIKVFFFNFEKNLIPLQLCKTPKTAKEIKSMNHFIHVYYQLALSIQDMDLFHLLMKKHPLDKNNPAHYKIILDLVAKAPLLTQEIDTTKTNQNGYYQPYIWYLENKDNAQIVRFSMLQPNQQPSSTTDFKGLLNYQIMISLLLGNDPKEIDKIMNSPDENEETIYNKWVQYLIDNNIQSLKIEAKQEIQQVNKKQKTI